MLRQGIPRSLREEEWNPVGFSIKGVYNDYGALEEYADDVFTQHLLETLKANTKQAPSSEVLQNLSDFVSALRYGESLRWVSEEGREGRMGLAFVREDIYQVAMGFGSPAVRQQADRYWSVLESSRDLIPALEKTEISPQRLVFLLLTASPNEHGRFLIAPELYDQWDAETRQEVFDRLLEDMMVSYGMWTLRKSWAVDLPISQQTEFDTHALYHETVARIANELYDKQKGSYED